jgi:hypothetical protein
MKDGEGSVFPSEPYRDGLYRLIVPPGTYFFRSATTGFYARPEDDSPADCPGDIDVLGHRVKRIEIREGEPAQLEVGFGEVVFSWSEGLPDPLGYNWPSVRILTSDKKWAVFHEAYPTWWARRVTEAVRGHRKRLSVPLVDGAYVFKWKDKAECWKNIFRLSPKAPLR